MFKKDLLLIDFEATGLNASKHDPIQLAALVLDKKTLKEKRAFSTYIKPRSFKNWDKEAMAVNNIDSAALKDAPSLNVVEKRFSKFIGSQGVIPAYYGGSIDIPYLHEVYSRTKKRYPFDYHALDLWGICLVYLALRNDLKNKKRPAGFTLEDLMKRFHIPIEKRHDALGDCRAEAEVFRQIYHSLTHR